MYYLKLNKKSVILLVVFIFILFLSIVNAKATLTTTLSKPEVNSKTQQQEVVKNNDNTQTQKISSLVDKQVPSYLPINNIKFANKNYNHDVNDLMGADLREQMILKIQAKSVWPSGTFIEAKKSIVNVLIQHRLVDNDKPFSSSFYKSIEVVLLKKLITSGGFVFKECIEACQARTKITLSDTKMKIRRQDVAKDFIKKQRDDKKIDGVFKWDFLVQANIATLDIRLISVNNTVLWQDYLTIDLDDKEFLGKLQKTNKSDPYPNELRTNLSLKSQEVTYVPSSGQTTSVSNYLLAFNYGIKGSNIAFESMRYQVGTRVQMNVNNVADFYYFTLGLDTRIGYSFNKSKDDVFVLYVAYFEEFFLVPGKSIGIIGEFNLSDDYYINLGFEKPIDSSRKSVGNADIYEIGTGLWLELGVKY